MGTRVFLVVAVASSLAVAGCAQPHATAVRSVAERFYVARAHGDGAAACAELAPRTKSELEQSAGKPCAQAVLQEQVPDVQEVERLAVFGTQAEVDWGSETTFLSRFQGGWKVMAAVCQARSGQPYDCSISGG